MKPNDHDGTDLLRTAFTSFGEVTPGAGDCPPAERIWMAVRGELPPRDIKPIVLHTSVCGACAEAWRIAHGAASEVQVVRAPDRPGAWRSVWVWGPGLAAAALLLIGLVVDGPFDLSDRGPSTQYRDSATTGIRSLLPDNAELDRNELVLRWSPGPEGSRYNIKVLTEDLTIVSQSFSLPTSEYTIPVTAVSSLPSGTRLLWQVEAVGKDQPRQSSPTYTVRLQ